MGPGLRQRTASSGSTAAVLAWGLREEYRRAVGETHWEHGPPARRSVEKAVVWAEYREESAAAVTEKEAPHTFTMNSGKRSFFQLFDCIGALEKNGDSLPSMSPWGENTV